jgi:hypothetical protein
MTLADVSTSIRMIRRQPWRRPDRGNSGKPSPVAPTPRFGRQIPLGMLGMIAMVVAIECFIGRNWLDYTDPVSLSWRFSADAARTKATGIQVLCVGDSLVKHGLIPSVIEEATGRRTLNLSAARAPMLMSYFLLRRALDSGSHPDAIVINAKPAVLLGGPEFNARYFEEVLTPREWVELFQMSRRASVMTSMLVGRILPSVRCRLEVRSHCLSAMRCEADPLREINRTLWRNWRVNDGANVANLDSSYQEAATAELGRRMQTDIFHVDRMNVEGIERLLQLASERKIPVFWLLAPLTPGLQTLRDRSGSEAAYERFVRSTQARYPQVLTVLDARRAAYPPEAFIDSTHLNGRGAVILSRAVATALNGELGMLQQSSGRRWTSLSQPVTNTDILALHLEDIEQSKKTVRRDPNLD